MSAQGSGEQERGETKELRVLDLFCGVGGATAGYWRAGFKVVGIDIRPQPNYLWPFIQADALKPPVDLGEFDLIHASPPCQEHTRAKHLRKAQGHKRRDDAPDLVAPTRAMLQASGRPWIMENVPGAPMPHAVSLCGSAFGLKVRRHRWFESSMPLWSLSCRHGEQGRPVGVYHVMGDEVPHGGRTARTLDEGRDAMGMYWVETWDELKEAIPPRYTQWLGVQILDMLLDSKQVPGAGVQEVPAHD